MTFKSFLKSGIKSGEFSGPEIDFAKDAVADKKFREFDDAESLDTFVMFHGGCDAARHAAGKLYNRWRSANRSAAKAEGGSERDCLNADDIKKIQKALRQVWSWSHSRRLVLKRCDLGEGYSRCEKCRRKVPKVHVDHIVAVGTFDGGYIERLFVPSAAMQGLCAGCHKIKTKADLATIKAKRSKVIEDFF